MLIQFKKAFDISLYIAGMFSDSYSNTKQSLIREMYCEIVEVVHSISENNKLTQTLTSKDKTLALNTFYCFQIIYFFNTNNLVTVLSTECSILNVVRKAFVDKHFPDIISLLSTIRCYYFVYLFTISVEYDYIAVIIY